MSTPISRVTPPAFLAALGSLVIPQDETVPAPSSASLPREPLLDVPTDEAPLRGLARTDAPSRLTGPPLATGTDNDE